MKYQRVAPGVVDLRLKRDQRLFDSVEALVDTIEALAHLRSQVFDGSWKGLQSLDALLHGVAAGHRDDDDSIVGA